MANAVICSRLPLYLYFPEQIRNQKLSYSFLQMISYFYLPLVALHRTQHQWTAESFEETGEIGEMIRSLHGFGSRPSSENWTSTRNMDLGSGKWERFVGRSEEDEDVKRLRKRAQDNIEFRSVTISAPQYISSRRRATEGFGGTEGSLEMSISYRGRKGFMPDIELLVVRCYPLNEVYCAWEYVCRALSSRAQAHVPVRASIVGSIQHIFQRCKLPC